MLNVLLAQCICDTGLTADPENIITEYGSRIMPDVLISMHGLRCAVDGKYASTSAKQDVAAQVSARIQSGLCHIGVGVLYPPRLRSMADFDSLKTALLNEQLEFYIATESVEEPSWANGNLHALLGQVRVAHMQLASDDVVTRCVEYLQDGMRAFTASIAHNRSACESLASLLGVYEESKKQDHEIES